MLRFISSLLILLNLTSCVGYGVLSGSKNICDPFDPKCSPYSYRDKSDILEQLGNPDKIFVDNNNEYWVYHKHCRYCPKQLAFRGIILGLIVPVPLVLPIGYNNVTFKFDKDKSIKTVTYEKTKDTAFLCGLILAGHAEFGCYVK